MCISLARQVAKAISPVAGPEIVTGYDDERTLSQTHGKTSGELSRLRLVGLSGVGWYSSLGRTYSWPLPLLSMSGWLPG